MNSADLSIPNDLESLLRVCTSLYQSVFYKVLGIQLPILTEETLSNLLQVLSFDMYQLDISDKSKISNVAEDFSILIDFWKPEIWSMVNNPRFGRDIVETSEYKQSVAYDKLMIAIKHFKENYIEDSGIKSCIDAYLSGVPLEDILA